MRPWLTWPPMFCSRRENICANHCACTASRKVRAGCSGTCAQTAAISSSSRLRPGFASREAISAASVE